MNPDYPKGSLENPLTDEDAAADLAGLPRPTAAPAEDTSHQDSDATL